MISALGVACADLLGIDDRFVAPADAGADQDATASADTGPSDAGSEADAPLTPDSGCPADMVRVGTFCIDATEVTQRAYAAFEVARMGDAGGQSSICSFNDDWTPKCTGFSAGYTINASSTLPVACVDWCDAYGYCAWAGKHLCGRIGGGPIASDAGTTSADEWFTACSDFGTRVYPYGHDFDGSACNTLLPQGKVAPVGTFPRCVGGVPGLYDMAGNVWEWEDSCDGLDTDAATCSQRGGAYVGFTINETKCISDFPTRTIFTKTEDTGFRCCVDP